MAKYRKSKQEFATVAALVAYNEVVNKNNDTIFIEALQKDFNWIQGSTAVADSVKILDQTSETAKGRWICSSAVQRYTGVAAILSMDNGQSYVANVAVAGLAVGDSISVTALNMTTAYGGVVVPEGLRIKLLNAVSAAGQVQVEVLNETGLDDTLAFNLNIEVIKFL